MDVDLAALTRLMERIAVRAAVQVVKAAPSTGLLTQPSWVMGTVSGGGAAGASLQVFIDGSTEAIPIENGAGVPLPDAARVQVLFRPTGGAIITGLAGSSTAGLASTVGPLAVDTASIALPVPIGVRKLELVASLRSNYAGLRDTVRLKINDDTSSDYAAGGVWNPSSSTAGGGSANYHGFVFLGECHGNTAAAGMFSPLEIDAADPSGANQKEGFSRAGVAGTLLYTLTWRWPKTDPITKMELVPGNGTAWKIGSAAWLYVR